MNPLHRTLVHHALATQLRIAASAIEDGDRFEDLGLDDLDLVLVVLRLESLDQCGELGPLPFEALERGRTVADLVALVDHWLLCDDAPPSTSSAA